MRQNLNSKFVAGLQIFFGILSHSYACGRTCDDDCTGGEGRSLGEEAYELGDAEDEVAVYG